ncbi:MAG TPA: M15 family metallopeptidase [Candidatus Saccharimonadales bacterium]
MSSETQTPAIDINRPDPYLDLKEQRPDLFEPIPQRIGVSLEYPGGFPNGIVDGWRDMESMKFNEVAENGEPLVNLAHLQPPIFTTGDYNAKLTNSMYEQPLDGSTVAQYVREGVGEKLVKAQSLLPRGYRLVMFDAWRSLETQYATYEMCYDSLVEMLKKQGVIADGEELTEEAKAIISRETQKFISLPSPLPEAFNQDPREAERARQIPSPHNTGGSVDIGIAKVDDEYLDELTELEEIAAFGDDPYAVERVVADFSIARIYREHSRILDFGTEFDFASQKSALVYCEDSDELGGEAKDNRRMLYNVMTQAGFEPYEEEWWHFNCDNQMARMTESYRTGMGKPALYGNAELSGDQKKHELIHRQVFDLLVASAEDPSRPLDIPSDLLEYGVTEDRIRKFASSFGHPQETNRFPQTWDMKYRGELSEEFIAAVKRSLVQ